MAELSKKIFKGIRQVNLSTYQSYSDKEGYLWLIKDGENRHIYFGNQLYSDIVPEKTDGQTKKLITEALDKLIGQDLLHSFDNDGNLKNEIKLDLQTTDDGKEILHLVGKDDEDIATLDMSKFAIDGMVDTVSYDNTTHSLKITWNTESGKSNTVIDLTDLVDIYTSGNGVTVGSDGVVSIKLSDDNQDFLTVDKNGLSLKNIDGSHIEIGNTITDDNDAVIDKSSNITDILQKLFTNIKDVKTNALSVKGDGSSINVVPDGVSSTSKILSLKTESATIDTINHENVEIVSSSSDGVYGQMYYMSNIESVSGNIEEPNISGENVSLYKAEISENKRLNIVATDEVELEDVTFKGEFPKTTANAIAKINGGKTVTLTNVVFDDTVKGYNGFEIGLNSNDLPKRVDIKNCDFKGKLNNNAILIFGTDNDAVINIENCHFADISNALRLSNKTNSKNVTVNIKDCVVDKWDSRKEWEGFLICEDYTSPDLNSAEANNLFAPEKIHVNFINLIYQGEKITPDTDKKIYYVYYDNGGEQTDENKLPKVVIS